jgi:hypothetical protein
LVVVVVVVVVVAAAAAVERGRGAGGKREEHVPRAMLACDVALLSDTVA